MPPIPRILKQRGCDPLKWKSLFTAKPDEKDKRIKKLEELIQARISDGRKKNIQEYRTFAAIDMAYNSPFAQTASTMINSFVSRDWKGGTHEQILAELEKWGLKQDELFLKVPQANGGTALQLNVPTFNQVLLPIVQSYSKIVWASLFNPRNQNPLYKYEPAQANDEMRTICEMITSVIQQMVTDFGYAADLKQEILQTLLYGICLVFPKEVWYTEKQVGEDNKPELQKEGIRYFAPHPVHMFYDQRHNPCTFNTDTGCEFAGHSKAVAYGEILDNTQYWNRRTVAYGSTDWMATDLTSSLYQEVYPCVMNFPSVGEGSNTREGAAGFYSSHDRDKTVWQTDLWMKINPKRWGLGDYNHKIWVRFIVAQDCTVLYAEPCCYSPIIYYGYDADQLRDRNSSFALECIPHQTGIGNTLAQIILTCKQNLANIHFYDKNIIDPADVDKLKNQGEAALRGLNLLSFDSQKNRHAGLDVTQAVHSLSFTAKDVAPLFQCLNIQLAMLERLQQVSSQEAGSAASHQQSVVEIKTITGSTTNRRALSGTFIDDASDARKRQQLHAALAYMDDEVVAYVPSDTPNVLENLSLLGFKVASSPLKRSPDNKIRVTGSKKQLRIDGIALSGSGSERRNDTQTAQVMMQAVAAIANSQFLAAAVGPENLLKIIQKAIILAGADKDFKLSVDHQQQANQLQQMLQEASQQIMMATTKKVEDDVSKQVAQEMAKMQQEISVLEQAVQKLIQQSGVMPPNPNVNPNLPAPGQPQAGAIGAPPVV